MNFATAMELPSAAIAQRLSASPPKRVAPGSNPGVTAKGRFWILFLLCIVIGVDGCRLRLSHAQSLVAPRQPPFAWPADLPAQPPPWLANLLAKARQAEDQFQQPNQQPSASSRGPTDNIATNREPATASPVNLMHELTGAIPSSSFMTHVTACSVWITEEVLRPSFLTLATLLPLASGLYLLNRRALATIFRVTLSYLVLLVSGVVTTRQLLYPWFMRLMPTDLSTQAPFYVALGCAMTLGAHVLGAKMWMARDLNPGPSATSTSAHTNELPPTSPPKLENSSVLNGQSARVVEPTKSTPPADQMATTAGFSWFGGKKTKGSALDSTVQRVTDQLAEAIATTTISTEDRRKLAGALMKLGECGFGSASLCALATQKISDPKESSEGLGLEKEAAKEENAADQKESKELCPGTHNFRNPEGIREGPPDTISDLWEELEKATAETEGVTLLPLEVQRFLREHPAMTGAEFRSHLGKELDQRRREQGERQRVTPAMRAQLTNFAGLQRVIQELRLQTPFWRQYGEVEVPEELAHLPDLNLTLLRRYLTQFLDKVNIQKLVARGVDVGRCDKCGHLTRGAHACIQCESKPEMKGGIYKKKQTTLMTDGQNITQHERVVPDLDKMEERLRQARELQASIRDRQAPYRREWETRPKGGISSTTVQDAQGIADAVAYSLIRPPGEERGITYPPPSRPTPPKEDWYYRDGDVEMSSRPLDRPPPRREEPTATLVKTEEEPEEQAPMAATILLSTPSGQTKRFPLQLETSAFLNKPKGKKGGGQRPAGKGTQLATTTTTPTYPGAEGVKKSS
jgi:hypothetical protein